MVDDAEIDAMPPMSWFEPFDAMLAGYVESWLLRLNDDGGARRPEFPVARGEEQDARVKDTGLDRADIGMIMPSRCHQSNPYQSFGN